MHILYIRSYIPDVDGKFNKYKQAVEDNHLKWAFLGWDRTGTFTSKFKDNTYLYKRKSSLGGGWKNILNILLWNIYICTFLLKNKKKYDIYHIIDFDSAILAFPLLKILNKKIIFDVYDKYTSMRKFPYTLQKTIDLYENYIIKHSNLSILADESRVRQHNITLENNIIILENIPMNISVPANKSTPLNSDDNNTRDKMIGYFGVLEKNNRGLEDMVNSVINSEGWVFHIAGYGELSEYFQEQARKNPNKIKFHGPKKPNEGLLLMSQMDLLLGLYYKNVPNHLFAAPNKYFEHLMLGKAFLTTEGTPPGEKTILHNTGWSITEGYESLYKTLNKITNTNLNNYSLHARKLWKNKYSNYYTTHYAQEYITRATEIFSK